MALKNARKGAVLLIAVCLASVSLVCALFFLRDKRVDSVRVPDSVRRMQASYLAKGCLQLALLKAKLLKTPLSHALDFSVGKNPFYVHSAGYEHLDGSPPSPYLTAPGPAFLTGLASIENAVLKRARIKEIPGAASSRSSSDWDADGVNDFIVDQHLILFRLDLADRTWAYDVYLNEAGGGRRHLVLKGQDKISVSSTYPCPRFASVDPYSARMRIAGILIDGDRLRIEAEAVVRVKGADGRSREYTARESACLGMGG